MYLFKLVRLHIRSQHRVFSLSCWPRVCMEEFCETLVPRGLLLLERNLEKVDFPVEEFLPKKINNKEVYVDYSTTEDIPEDACSLNQYGDLTSLN